MMPYIRATQFMILQASAALLIQCFFSLKPEPGHFFATFITATQATF
jgi:hypothetical protein